MNYIATVKGMGKIGTGLGKYSKPNDKKNFTNIFYTYVFEIYELNVFECISITHL